MLFDFNHIDELAEREQVRFESRIETCLIRCRDNKNQVGLLHLT